QQQPVSLVKANLAKSPPIPSDWRATGGPTNAKQMVHDASHRMPTANFADLRVAAQNGPTTSMLTSIGRIEGSTRVLPACIPFPPSLNTPSGNLVEGSSEKIPSQNKGKGKATLSLPLDEFRNSARCNMHEYMPFHSSGVAVGSSEGEIRLDKEVIE